MILAMSDSDRAPDSGDFPDTLRFTDSEIDILARTADAMSAWMGKPVLAQVIDATELGFEWVIFAIPLLPSQDASGITVVQIGGPGARIIGSQGGLQLAPDEIYDCEYLWAIQLSALQGVRYIKVDGTGEEVAWTSDLTEIIPFDLDEAWLNDEFADDDDGYPDDDEDDYPDDDDDGRTDGGRDGFGITGLRKAPRGPTLH